MIAGWQLMGILLGVNDDSNVEAASAVTGKSTKHLYAMTRELSDDPNSTGCSSPIIILDKICSVARPQAVRLLGQRYITMADKRSEPPAILTPAECIEAISEMMTIAPKAGVAYFTRQPDAACLKLFAQAREACDKAIRALEQRER